MNGANTPSPTDAALLPRSLEKDSANHKATVQCARAGAAVRPKPVQCRPGSQSNVAAWSDARPALVARPAYQSDRQTRRDGPPPVERGKFPSGSLAFSR